MSNQLPAAADTGTAGVADRWLASEVSLAIGAENPLRYSFGEWVEDVD